MPGPWSSLPSATPAVLDCSALPPSGLWGWRGFRIGPVVEGAHQLGTLLIGQVRTEMKQGIQDVAGLEVGLAAGEVQEASGGEPPLLVEHEADAPVPAGDGLAAAAALGLRGGSALGAVDTGQAALSRAAARGPLERLRFRNVSFLLLEGFGHRLRPLVGGGPGMEAECRLPLGVGVRDALPETQRSLFDLLPAAAALGATTGGGLEDVRHDPKDNP